MTYDLKPDRNDPTAVSPVSLRMQLQKRLKGPEFKRQPINWNMPRLQSLLHR